MYLLLPKVSGRGDQHAAAREPAWPRPWPRPRAPEPPTRRTAQQDEFQFDADVHLLRPRARCSVPISRP